MFETGAAYSKGRKERLVGTTWRVATCGARSDTKLKKTSWNGHVTERKIAGRLQ